MALSLTQQLTIWLIQLSSPSARELHCSAPFEWSLFFGEGQPRPLFVLFKQYFYTKNENFSETQTLIVRVEGKDASPPLFGFLNRPSLASFQFYVFVLFSTQWHIKHKFLTSNINLTWINLSNNKILKMSKFINLD